jgi:hypothetical protein
MTTSLTSSTTIAFAGAFVGVFFNILGRIIGAFAFGTLALVFLALWTTSAFFYAGVFGGAGFNICSSFTNWATAWRSSFLACFCFQTSVLAACCTFRASFALSSACSYASLASIYSLAATTFPSVYILTPELSSPQRFNLRPFLRLSLLRANASTNSLFSFLRIETYVERTQADLKIQSSFQVMGLRFIA